MKKSTRILIGGMVVAILALWVILINISRDHPLAASIGLELVDDYTPENSINRAVRVLIYSKRDAESDLYNFICGKARSMYSGDGFISGKETQTKQAIKDVRSEYSHGELRSFEIRSRDERSVICVIEYDLYVAVVLADARI